MFGTPNMSDEVFKDVVGKAFPLRATLTSLNSFVDTYLNSVDPEQTNYFKAYTSFVFMQVISYGSMAVEGSKVGKITQNEVIFGIPIMWYKRDENGSHHFNGRTYKLVGNSVVTPFVFVDNPFTLWGGREIFGWPKTIMQVDAQVSNWTTSPLLDSNLFKVSGSLLEKQSTNIKPTFVPIVEIEQQRDASLTVQRFASNDNFSWIDELQQQMRVFQSVYKDAASFWMQTVKATSLGESLLKDALMNISGLPGQPAARGSSIIGLKQFRDANNPSHACYQAIGSSSSRITKVHGAGLLGTIEKSLASISGGFTIKIHEHLSKPIITTLGLKLTNVEWVDGHPVGTIKPVLPFWINLDMVYGGSEPIYVDVLHSEGQPNPDLSMNQLPPFQSEYFDLHKPEAEV